MKRLINILGIILTVIMVICETAEFLAIPALFVVIGILNKFSWQYYAITIGGYIALLIVIDIVARLIFKALDKKYTPIITRKIEKYCDRFSKNSGSL